jgi:hypothetical protein
MIAINTVAIEAQSTRGEAKFRPILFSAPMVRALLDGSKTQTRRIVKPQPEWTEPNTQWQTGTGHSGPGWYAHNSDYPEEGALFYRCPYGQTGDRLYVRETWAETDLHDGTPVVAYRAGGCIPVGRDTGDGPDFLIHKWAQPDTTCCEAWKPSIHMPRWASRITLEITGVRVERLQDISEADALAEGIRTVRTPEWDRQHFGEWRAESDSAMAAGKKPPIGPLPSTSYQALWNDINGPGSWDANPWVWVVEFKRLEAPCEK